MVRLAMSTQRLLWVSTDVGVIQATAQSAFSTPTNKEDPYIYQVGFGNSFASEAMWVQATGLTALEI